MIGSLIFGLFCLACLLAGIVVWFRPDQSFNGDPFILKCIVAGGTRVIFGPMFYFSFVKKTVLTVEVDKRAHTRRSCASLVTSIGGYSRFSISLIGPVTI